MSKGISVIVCTYNGASRIFTALQSLLEQELSPEINYELLVVDNRSTDGTAELVREYLGSHAGRFPWRVLFEAEPGLSHARLSGMKAARYDWVLFCDDDNRLFPGYLAEGWRIISAATNAGAVGGHGIAVFEGEKPEWFEQYSHSYAVGPQAGMDGEMGRLAEVYGAGMFLNKKTVLDLYAAGLQSIMSDRKGNSMASGGDVELCYLVQLKGKSVWYDESLKFWHDMPAGRLTWDYYLRLKGGIAAGEAALLPYRFILKEGPLPLWRFTMCYCGSFLRNSAIFIYFRLKSFLRMSAYSKEQQELADVVLYHKAVSFPINFFRCHIHYRKLSKLVGGQI